jgi:demethylmenaquinone methyltransferase / 2-methoxy-6-polyprenyl-1,4-benzoquinol methylase
MDHDKVTPYNSADDKRSQVAQMFDNISGRYDFLNDLLSLGIHKGWRKRCVRKLRSLKPLHILDVATGTGDFAIACMSLNPQKITGIDISEGMLSVGREKVRKKGLAQKIILQQGNAENVAFPDASFDAIVVGFGVRNFENLEAGLSNLLRVLKPGGKLIVLEFSYPTNIIVKAGYNFYFSYVTPLIGRVLSKDPRAYSYLTESVKAFPNNEKFIAVLQKLGYRETRFESLSLGIAAIYEGTR